MNTENLTGHAPPTTEEMWDIVAGLLNKKHENNIDEAASRIASRTWAELAAYTEQQRLDFLYILGYFFCMHCGRGHPPGLQKCQCWNDE